MGLWTLFSGATLQARALIAVGVALAIALGGFVGGFRVASVLEEARAAESAQAELKSAEAAYGAKLKSMADQAKTDAAIVARAESDRAEALAAADLTAKTLAQVVAARPGFKQLKIDAETRAAMNAALRGGK